MTDKYLKVSFEVCSQEKFLANFFDFPERIFLVSCFPYIERIASFIEFFSKTSKYIGTSPKVDGIELEFEHNIGNPHVIASSITIPNVSQDDAKIKASELL